MSRKADQIFLKAFLMQLNLLPIVPKLVTSLASWEIGLGATIVVRFRFQYIKITMHICIITVITLIKKPWHPIFNHLLGHVNASVMKTIGLLM